ncbi:hypothetical protein FACS189499_05120 [Clostridia bacterium]|nr:hypothetical protein FACS189499_05120 [Clostridia bacterium]
MKKIIINPIDIITHGADDVKRDITRELYTKYNIFTLLLTKSYKIWYNVQNGGIPQTPDYTISAKPIWRNENYPANHAKKIRLSKERLYYEEYEEKDSCRYYGDPRDSRHCRLCKQCRDKLYH